MKTIIKTILTLIIATGTIQISAQNTTPQKMNNDIDSFSYAIGYSVASNLSQSSVDSLSYEQLVEGFKDYFEKNPAKIDAGQLNKVIQDYIGGLAMKKHEGNIEQGKKFLAENATKEGVQTTPSGLQYKIVKQGTGAVPKDGDQVTTHYTGRLIDGTIFDSSVKRGQPASFGVNQVIAGWTEALKMMPTGSKWELYIPYNLAYGERDMGTIKPYSCLIFEIELISINGK